MVAMDGLQCLLIVFTLFSTVACLYVINEPGFKDLKPDKEIKTCEGFDDNLDASGLTIYEQATGWVIDGDLALKKNYNSPIKVSASLLRPDDSPIETFSTSNLCSQQGSRGDLDVFDQVLYDLKKKNNNQCPLKKGSVQAIGYINEYMVSRLAKLIDQEGTMQMKFGNDACIEFNIKRVSGTKDKPTRKAGSAPSSNPAQKGKTGGLQKIFKFLKDLLSK